MNLSGKNLLGDETSPYLRQHKDNPVHWMPWGELRVPVCSWLFAVISASATYPATAFFLGF